MDGNAMQARTGGTRRFRRVGTLSTGFLLILATAAAGCSEEQVRDIDEVAIQVDLQLRTTNALKTENTELDGELDCDVDVTAESTLAGSCDGVDTAGSAVRATLSGVVDIDKATCDATLIITLGDKTLVDNPSYDCLD